MKETSQNKFSMIHSGRLEREQELVQLLFTGPQNEITQKLDQLEPKGCVNLISVNLPPVEQ